MVAALHGVPRQRLLLGHLVIEHAMHPGDELDRCRARQVSPGVHLVYLALNDDMRFGFKREEVSKSAPAKRSRKRATASTSHEHSDDGRAAQARRVEESFENTGYIVRTIDPAVSDLRLSGQFYRSSSDPLP